MNPDYTPRYVRETTPLLENPDADGVIEFRCVLGPVVYETTRNRNACWFNIDDFYYVLPEIVLPFWGTGVVDC
ncbi:MAG: hypothetical protein Ct9H300mP25_03570 [Acidobacteriota bacterium]|nr:MAG: hypothetical protein Ct9H300mP25_03570 [Acidobacteriota bacterium]